MKFALSVLLASTLLIAADDKKAASKAAPAEVKDVVCGMTVDPKTADKAEYKGKTYYFCNRDEKVAFEKNPEKYVAKADTKKK